MREDAQLDRVTAIRVQILVFRPMQDINVHVPCRPIHVSSSSSLQNAL